MKTNAGLAVLFLWKNWAIIGVFVFHFSLQIATDMIYLTSLANNYPLSCGDNKQRRSFSFDGQISSLFPSRSTAADMQHLLP